MDSKDWKYWFSIVNSFFDEDNIMHSVIENKDCTLVKDITIIDFDCIGLTVLNYQVL